MIYVYAYLRGRFRHLLWRERAITFQPMRARDRDHVVMWAMRAPRHARLSQMIHRIFENESNQPTIQRANDPASDVNIKLRANNLRPLAVWRAGNDNDCILTIIYII